MGNSEIIYHVIKGVAVEAGSISRMTGLDGTGFGLFGVLYLSTSLYSTSIFLDTYYSSWPYSPWKSITSYWIFTIIHLSKGSSLKRSSYTTFIVLSESSFLIASFALQSTKDGNPLLRPLSVCYVQGLCLPEGPADSTAEEQRFLRRRYICPRSRRHVVHKQLVSHTSIFHWSKFV
jgi:hypothetical protein